MIPLIEKCPENQFLSENISEASFYPLKVIQFHFSVKKNYVFIFIKLALFWSILPYELQENLEKSDQ